MVRPSVLNRRKNKVESDCTTPIARLTPLVDSVVDRFYWFYPYLAGLFPEVTCSKKYFFIYSTDHSVGAGAICWGEGDNLDLTDFVELGTIFSYQQCETPYLIRDTNRSKPLQLFFHTRYLEGGNLGIQNTRLFECAGGLLHEASWTDRGRPFTQGGLEEGDQHLGYAMFYPALDGTWARGIGFKGENPESEDNVPIYQYYHTAGDLSDFDRGDIIDARSPEESDRFYSLTFGRFLNWNGIPIWAGTTNPRYPPGLNKKQWVICRATEDLEIKEMIIKLNNNQFQNTMSPFIEGDTLHIYHANDTVSLDHCTVDLLQISNWR